MKRSISATRGSSPRMSTGTAPFGGEASNPSPPSPRTPPPISVGRVPRQDYHPSLPTKCWFNARACQTRLRSLTVSARIPHPQSSLIPSPQPHLLAREEAQAPRVPLVTSPVLSVPRRFLSIPPSQNLSSRSALVMGLTDEFSAPSPCFTPLVSVSLFHPPSVSYRMKGRPGRQARHPCFRWSRYTPSLPPSLRPPPLSCVFDGLGTSAQSAQRAASLFTSPLLLFTSPSCMHLCSPAPSLLFIPALHASLFLSPLLKASLFTPPHASLFTSLSLRYTSPPLCVHAAWSLRPMPCHAMPCDAACRRRRWAASRGTCRAPSVHSRFRGTVFLRRRFSIQKAFTSACRSGCRAPSVHCRLRWTVCLGLRPKQAHVEADALLLVRTGRNAPSARVCMRVFPQRCASLCARGVTVFRLNP